MFAANVTPSLIRRRLELIDRRKFLWLAAGPIVEHEEMPLAAKPFSNPLDVVLKEKPLLEARAVPIGPRIAPAIEKISSPAPSPAQMAAGFFGRRAVINDPDLAKVGTAQY